MKKVLILGGNGYLGSYLYNVLKEKYNICRQGRKGEVEYKFSLFDKNKFLKIINDNKFDYIINLIAATNVDQCQSNIKYAIEGNISINKSIFYTLKNLKQRPFLIHISTDHLYEGSGRNKEEDVNPINNYAWSKFCGENVLEDLECAILRTNFFGKNTFSKKIGYTDWLYNSFLEKTNIVLFDDIYFNPIHLSTLVENILLVMKMKIGGTFNLSSEGDISKARFGLEFAKQLKIDTNNANVGSQNDVNLLCKRPKNMVMENELFKNTFKTTLPDIEEEIVKSSHEYRNK